MSGTTYVYEPVFIPIDASFSHKSGLTTAEAVLIKDYVLYMAKEKYESKEYYTTSEIVVQAKRAAQEAYERERKAREQFVENIDWFKVLMALIIVMFFCNWLKRLVKDGF